MRYLILIISFLGLSCETSVNPSSNASLFKQYGLLLHKSAVFDHENKMFKTRLKHFVDTCTEFNNYLGKRVKPVDSGTLSPIILTPYLFNKKQNKCIVMVLLRTKDLMGAPLDYVLFINSVKSKEWQFMLKEGYRQSFSYEGDVFLLSDTEISLRVVRNMVSLGHLHAGDIGVNDSVFESDSSM